MATRTRLPNKAGWALDEALGIDPDIARLLAELLRGLEGEIAQAQRAGNQQAQLRLGRLVVLQARLQGYASRLAELHRMARKNEYDQYLDDKQKTERRLK